MNELIARVRAGLLCPSRSSWIEILHHIEESNIGDEYGIVTRYVRNTIQKWEKREIGGMRFPLREQLGEVGSFSDALVYCPESSVGQKGFWMGQTPVTQVLYRAVMGENPSRFRGDEWPVEQVSWCGAVRFCNRLSEMEGLQPTYKIHRSEIKWNREANGYSLPTEAQWEYAAKAGTELIYAGSDDIDEVAWYRHSGDRLQKRTHPVAEKKPNAWGLYDMSGNVFEWCYESGVTESRHAPTRGGSWMCRDSVCGIEVSQRTHAGLCLPDTGFRLVLG